MKQLLNTLFVTSEDIYLSLDGENVVANRSGTAVARYPLHTLQSIVSFAYSGASPALMRAFAGISGLPSASQTAVFWRGFPARSMETSYLGGCSIGRQMIHMKAAALPAA